MHTYGWMYKVGHIGSLETIQNDSITFNTLGGRWIQRRQGGYIINQRNPGRDARLLRIERTG